ncbi:MAG: ATP phosphoribosyltransferase [Dehalococcoidia bacterium]|tara:strand:- start:989 stop:2002 length:1014 start_codon:yes stop_codon:yes gene_type:complete
MTVIKENNEELVIVIPSDGELHKNTMDFMDKCGLKIRPTSSRGYTGSIPSMPGVSVLMQRTADITNKIEDFSADIGITGLDRYLEYKTDDRYVGKIVSDLGYGGCDFVLAVPDSWIDVNGLEDLSDLTNEYRQKGLDLRIATKYPKLLNNYLYDNGIYNYRIVAVSGALEAAPAAGYADLIADLTATGTTLRANNLKQINEGTVLRSQACLIGNPESINNNKYKFELTTKLIDLIKSNIRAEEYYRLTANVLCDSEENLAALILSHPDISGLHGPTLSRLHNKSDMSWFSVSVVVPKYNLSSCVSQIRECGGVSIAASKIDYLFNEEVVENDRIFIA